MGPIFTREATIAPRRGAFYVTRTVFAGFFFLMICTAWLVMAGTQTISNVGDMARFGETLFRILAPLQFAVVTFLAVILCASIVAREKDRRTLVLLLMTRMSNTELVTGKLLAGLLHIAVLLMATLPVFMLTLLFGGVSTEQVWRVFAVTAATAVMGGSIGCAVAFRLYKTFQTLTVVFLLLVVWMVLWEPIHAGLFGVSWGGIKTVDIADTFSPVRALAGATQPTVAALSAGRWYQDPVVLFIAAALLPSAVINLFVIFRVRVWNPSRETRKTVIPEATEAAASESISGQAKDDARAGHVDARLRDSASTSSRTRRVWDNPVAWREIKTRAYGHRLIFVQLGYIALLVAAGAGLASLTGEASGYAAGAGRLSVSGAVKIIAPFAFLSLVIVNALAATSITSERDGLSLDLLLATDLQPKEFIFGKLMGVFWVAKAMVLGPMLLCVWLWYREGMTLENLAYAVGGLAVLNLFVAVLGIHCGMIYSNSRVAIGTSLGTVFFMFLGVAACILMMISFSGSFSGQLAPFLAFILGGGVGLYVALGARTPSAAIGAAALLTPFATFYAITSFLLDYTLAVFLVTTVAYGFTTAALLIPALYEFDVAMGRTTED